MPADGTPFTLADAVEIVSPPKSPLMAAFAEIEAIAAAQPKRRDPIFRDDSDWPERVSLRRSVGLERDGF